MKTSDFYYELPKELIAQTPSAVRSESRLMVYSRADHTIEHRVFRDIVDYIEAGDVIVRNTTRVIYKTAEETLDYPIEDVTIRDIITSVEVTLRNV